MMAKLKPGVQVVKKKGLYYTLGSGNRLRRFKPWLGDRFSFLYDVIMSHSVFPKKFGGDIQKHYEVLTQALTDAHGKQVLELATGSGSAVHFLGSDNHYTGTDVSPALLKQAVKRFSTAGFSEPEFYVRRAEDLPFENDVFDLCLCILSFNFFSDVEMVLQEVGRVLIPGGALVCSVPVPERNRAQSRIRGVLYSEAEWQEMCQEYGFRFERFPCQNGALLYFRAIKEG
jgi:ubiquinone/menaquinone biosynthesis C-methylase UbiE